MLRSMGTPFLADFHVHSTFSDGKVPLTEVIDFYGQQGFGAIAVTDHIAESETLIGKIAQHLDQVVRADNFHTYLKPVQEEGERAWDQYGMVVIPGFELSKNSVSNHRSAHILGLGVSEYLPADGDALELIRGIHAQGGLAIAAHPVHTRKWEKQTYHLWDRREELAPHFDAWEVASGPHVFDEVAATRLPKLASSDLHVKKQIRAWKTVLHCERKPEAILQAVRRQEIDFRFYHGPRN